MTHQYQHEVLRDKLMTNADAKLSWAPCGVSFLPICSLVNERVYEGRLKPRFEAAHGRPPGNPALRYAM